MERTVSHDQACENYAHLRCTAEWELGFKPTKVKQSGPPMSLKSCRTITAVIRPHNPQVGVRSSQSGCFLQNHSIDDVLNRSTKKGPVFPRRYKYQNPCVSPGSSSCISNRIRILEICKAQTEPKQRRLNTQHTTHTQHTHKRLRN